MIPDKIIYTDGHGITVTDSNFKVKEKVYSLRGIIHHGISTVRASRVPAVILILLGVVSLLLGLLEFISPFVSDFIVNGEYISADYVALWLGIFFLVLGVVWLALIRDKYAVRIATAEGEKNAVLSNKKEYVNQIVAALNEAFRDRRDISVVEQRQI